MLKQIGARFVGEPIGVLRFVLDVLRVQISGTWESSQ